MNLTTEDMGRVSNRSGWCERTTSIWWGSVCSQRCDIGVSALILRGDLCRCGWPSGATLTPYGTDGRCCVSFSSCRSTP